MSVEGEEEGSEGAQESGAAEGRRTPTSTETLPSLLDITIEDEFALAGM